METIIFVIIVIFLFRLLLIVDHFLQRIYESVKKQEKMFELIHFSAYTYEDIRRQFEEIADSHEAFENSRYSEAYTNKEKQERLKRWSHDIKDKDLMIEVNKNRFFGKIDKNTLSVEDFYNFRDGSINKNQEQKEEEMRRSLRWEKFLKE